MTAKAECDRCGLLFEPDEVLIGKSGKYCGRPCKDLAEPKKPKPAPKPRAAAPEPAPASKLRAKAKPKGEALSPEPKAKRGAPAFRWTPEIESEILKRMAEGESLRTICKDDWLPSRTTVRIRAIEDEDFAVRYARARELQADELFDQIKDIADDSTEDWMDGDGGPKLDVEHVQRSKLRIDSRKWMAAKLRPKVYGDKIDLNHSGKLAVESVSVSFEDAGDSQDE